MRNIRAYIAGLLALVALGCNKDRPVTTPCGFDVSVDKVKGSKVEFTITPDNPNASYIYGLASENQDQFIWDGEKLIAWELGWMGAMYNSKESLEPAIGTFIDMFGYKGPRKFKSSRLVTGIQYRLYVIQIDPTTEKAIGPLHEVIFQTKAIPEVNLEFTLVCVGDKLSILPSDKQETWFWEYEMNYRIEDVYGDADTFFYYIIDMYENYGFLDQLLCRGNAEWVFSRDDRSLKEGYDYTLAIAGCADGELTTPIHYAYFSCDKEGRIHFDENLSEITVLSNPEAQP